MSTAVSSNTLGFSASTISLANTNIDEPLTDNSVSRAPEGEAVFGQLLTSSLPAQGLNVAQSNMQAQEPHIGLMADANVQDQVTAEQWLEHMLGQQQAQIQARDTQFENTAASGTQLSGKLEDFSALNVNSGALNSVHQAADSFALNRTEELNKFDSSNDESESTPVDTASMSLFSAITETPEVVIQTSLLGVRSGDQTDASASVDTRASANVNTEVHSGANRKILEADGRNFVAINAPINSSVEQTAAPEVKSNIDGSSRAEKTSEISSVNSQSVALTSPSSNHQLAANHAVLQLVGSTENTSVSAPSVSNGSDVEQSRFETLLKMPTQEAKWGEQLLHALRDRVHVQLQERIQSTSIRLDPPELGSLEIFLSHESGRLTVQISASQSDVARLLQSTSDRLRQDLTGPQFTEVNVQTSSDNQSGQQRSRQDNRSPFTDEQILAAAPQGAVGKKSNKAESNGNLLASV